MPFSARPFLASLLSILWLATQVVCAAPTDPDPSFGTGGLARIPGAQSVDDGALLRDGGVALVVDLHREDNRILKLDASGRVDPAFAPIRPAADPVILYPQIDAVAVLPDGRLMARTVHRRVPACDVFLNRYYPDGRADPGFSPGWARVWQGIGCSFYNLLVTPGGDAVFALSEGWHFGGTTRVVRVAPLGWGLRVDTQTGSRAYGRGAVAPDLRIAFVSGDVGASRFFGVVPDPGFGVDGFAGVTTSPPARGQDVGVDDAGRVLVAGIGDRSGVAQLVVARFTASGEVDMTFGESGVVYVPLARPGESVISARIAVQADGRALVAGTIEKHVGATDVVPRIGIARLTEDGRPDPTFAPGGMTDLWWERGAGLAFLGLRPDGRIVVGVAILPGDSRNGRTITEAAVVQLKGGDEAAAKPARERVAVEYFHVGFGHYFVTADPDEIALLDTTSSGGWARTGQSFQVWDDVDPSLVPVCRFWSDQTWTPKSSHFYTPYVDECGKVKTDTAWRFERNAFMVKMPQGTPGARTCLSGSRPLYRAYNAGKSGAPNHRYTPHPAILDAMLAQGWIMEGEATTRVFACVPLQ